MKIRNLTKKNINTYYQPNCFMINSSHMLPGLMLSMLTKKTVLFLVIVTVLQVQ